MKPSALILDRDGTLIAMGVNPKGEQDSAYFPEQLEFYPGLAALLTPWVQAEIPLFVVTNQPGIAKGHFTREDLARFHREMELGLLQQGIALKAIVCCTHHPVGADGGDPSLVKDCECRKPKPGMLKTIAADFGIDLSNAVMLGDSEVDVAAAKAAGLRECVLVRTLVSEKVPPLKRRWAYPQAPEFSDAIKKLERDWR